MNRTTFNSLLSNTNANDFGGRKGNFGASINGPVGVNQVMAADDLPEIVIYDMGYIDDTNTFQLYIPNNKVIVVGQRPAGQPVGEYRFTRNANNPDIGPGPYMMTVDDPDRIPRTIEVHDGHNGGHIMWFPSAVVVMTRQWWALDGGRVGSPQGRIRLPLPDVRAAGAGDHADGRPHRAGQHGRLQFDRQHPATLQVVQQHQSTADAGLARR
jgi:hypothetical protein